MANSSRLENHTAILLDKYVTHLHFQREAPVGGGRRLDFFAMDDWGHTYGIEVKSSDRDYDTGFGLNQETCTFGYVATTPEHVGYIVEHLRRDGYSHTGVLQIPYGHAKPIIIRKAVYNCEVDGRSPVLGFLSLDKIQSALC